MLQNRPNGNVVNGRKHNYGFNGVEENNDLGLNILETPFRLYDPTIARWTSTDPVIHFSQSTYNGFDGNPVFWSDPSGADSIYNYDTQQYVINGNVVSQAEAIAYAKGGGNSNGDNNNTPNDRYKLLEGGKVEYYDSKGGDNVDYLMDSDGNEIRLTDTSILPQLESQTLQDRAAFNHSVILTGNYAISQNHSQTKRLFEWIASRDTNEWSYKKGRTNTGTYSFIGTLHQSDQAPSLRRSKGFGDFETLINIHSHHGTALHDFQPSGSDIYGAQIERQRSPNAKFSVFSPLLTKENYNRAVEGKFKTFDVPYNKINYEPSKYIPY